MTSLLKTLRGAGDITAWGELSIDRDKAREKLQKFRLPDPHLYVLQFVRAASVLGAEKIEFHISSGEMWCSFPRTLPRGRLSDVWASTFETRRTPHDDAMHCLALGIGSAQALRPESIEIRSGFDRLRIVEGEEFYEETQWISGTEIHLEEKWRFGHLVEFFTTWDGLHAEGVALRKYCQMSLMDVIVNGASILEPRGISEEVFEHERSAGFVRLAEAEPGELSRFVFMRDNVQVRAHHAEPHHLPALGALNSNTLRTDLSGLQLAPDEALDDLLNQDLYGAYHEALRRWAEKSGRREAHLLIAISLFEHLNKLERAGIGVPEGTRALQGYIMRKNMFLRADEPGSPEVSLELACGHLLGGRQLRTVKAGAAASAVRASGQIGTSSQYVGPTEIEGYSCILLRVRGSLDDSVLSALRLSGIAVHDLTIRLENAAVAQRNREVWEARPVALGPQYRIQRYAVCGDYKGFVYFGTVSPDGRVGQNFGAQLRKDGRLLRRLAPVRKIGVVMDGPLRVNDRFDGVARDGAFRDLALALVQQLPALYRKLAADGLSTADPFAVELLHEYVEQRLAGNLATDFFVGLGYQLEEALALVETFLAEEPQFMHPGGFFSRDDVTPFIESLGPVADVPSFETLHGQLISLRAIVSDEKPPVILPRDAGPPDLGELETFTLLGDIVLVDPVREQIVRRLRHDTLDARVAVVSRQREAVYLESPEFRALPSSIVLARETDTEVFEIDGIPRRLDFELDLVGDGVSGLRTGCDVFIVYRDRLLAKRLWPTEMGAFRLVIRSDDWTPTVQMSNVDEDLLYFNASLAGDALTTRVLRRWFVDSVREGGVERRWLRLFLEYAFVYAEGDSEVPAFPMLVQTDDGWLQRFYSRAQLHKVSERHGSILYYTREDEVAAAEVVTEVLRAGTFPLQLLQGQFQGARLVHVGSASDRLSAREDYEKRPVAETTVPHCQVLWRGGGPGLNIEVGLFLDASGGANRECNRVDVLWEDRTLEHLVLKTPFGVFRSVITGDAIGPDPGFTLVATGRAEVIEMARRGAAETIRHACSTLPTTGGPAADEDLRRELMRYLGQCRVSPPAAPFDVLDALEAAPLFEMGDGQRLSFLQIGSAAQEGVIGYAPHPSRSNVLRMNADERKLHEAALGDRFALMPVSLLDEVLDEDGVLEFSDDLVLNRIANLLVAVRGERRDLFGDQLAYSLRWMSARESQRLCSVSAEAVEINPDDPLIEKFRASPHDQALLAFVASAVYSAVNAYYNEITDGDELTMQGGFLAHMKQALPGA